MAAHLHLLTLVPLRTPPDCRYEHNTSTAVHGGDPLELVNLHIKRFRSATLSVVSAVQNDPCVFLQFPSEADDAKVYARKQAPNFTERHEGMPSSWEVDLHGPAITRAQGLTTRADIRSTVMITLRSVRSATHVDKLWQSSMAESGQFPFAPDLSKLRSRGGGPMKQRFVNQAARRVETDADRRALHDDTTRLFDAFLSCTTNVKATRVRLMMATAGSGDTSKKAEDKQRNLTEVVDVESGELITTAAGVEKSKAGRAAHEKLHGVVCKHSNCPDTCCARKCTTDTGPNSDYQHKRATSQFCTSSEHDRTIEKKDLARSKFVAATATTA